MRGNVIGTPFGITSITTVTQWICTYKRLVSLRNLTCVRGFTLMVAQFHSKVNCKGSKDGFVRSLKQMFELWWLVSLRLQGVKGSHNLCVGRGGTNIHISREEGRTLLRTVVR